MPREVEQSSPINDNDNNLTYVTRRQADKEIERMMADVKTVGNNLYYFPKFAGLRVELREGKSIKDYVVKLIESRHNLKSIEKTLKNNAHAKKNISN